MNEEIETTHERTPPARGSSLLLGCPADVPPQLFGWMMASALALALSLGLQVLVTSVIVFGPLKEWPAPETMTVMGQVMVHPEHDMLAYVGGLAFTCIVLLLAAGAVRWQAGRLARIHEFPAQASAAVVPGVLLHLTLAMGSMTAFLVCVELVRRSAYERWSLHPLEAILLLLPALMTIAVLIVHRVWPSCWPSLARWLSSPPRYARWAFDAAVFVGIVLLLFVPPSADLAARIYLREGFLHWDYFAMGPATQYALGSALGTDVFVLYGIGFPTLLGLLDSIWTLSHQGALHLLIAYGCVYFFGVYCLLRALRVARPAAAMGVLLALLLTFFAPIWIERETLWQWPSTSILRSPTDVWLFAALAMHAYTSRLRWLIAASVSAFLGLFFITDTGVGLLIVLALYSIYWILAPRPSAVVPSRLKRVGEGAIAFAVGFLTLAIGLLIASRGTLVTDSEAFLLGWLEAVLSYGGMGMGSMYFLARVSVIDIAVFVGIVALSLVAMSRGGLRALGRRPAADEVVIALLGFYALGRLTYFLYRTLPNNLYHASVPVAVLLVVLGARWGGAWCLRWARQAQTFPERSIPRFVRAAMPVPLVVLVVLGIWYSPSFRDYPSALRVMAKGAPSTGSLYLLPEQGQIGGIPMDEADRVEAFAETIDRMRALHAEGHRVVMLDHTATIHYLTARVPPSGRDIGAYYNILFWEQMEAYQRSILADPPDFILIRSDVPNPYFEDSWSDLRVFLEECAARVETAGLFDVYAWGLRAQEASDADSP